MQTNKFKLSIVGMTCVNCSNAIERATSKIDGVKSANVNFSLGIGEFVVRDESTIDAIKQKIQKLGYEIAIDYDDLEKRKIERINNIKNKLIVGFVLTFFIMYFEMFSSFKFGMEITFLFTAIVVCYCGSDFFKNAFKSLVNKNFDMNVLVALGSGVAFLYSCFIFAFSKLDIIQISHHGQDGLFHMYFEGASMIITFILLGKFLEERTKIKANDYIKSLLNLAPKKALLLKGNGVVEEILADEIKIGDIVLVKTGMNIPCDGIVINGGAEIDTSFLTGESLPVYKTIGDTVNAGCINTNGFLNIKCNVAKFETLLSRITQLLSDASSKKMPIARFADKIANIFVPVVIILSIITFLTWTLVFSNFYYGIVCAVSVLIISCPCALGLATPIAIVCAVSNCAKHGILVKNPEILEYLKNIKVAIFDKTGTLTEGKISVYKTNLTKSQISIIAGISSLSEHLISRAITDYACKNSILLCNFGGKFENIVGKGIRANDNSVVLGNIELLLESKIQLPNTNENLYNFINNDTDIQSLYKDGFGLVFAAIDGVYVGYFALSDSLKESSISAISSLKKMNIKTVILTGDNEKTAKFIAKSLSVEDIYSNCLPQDKLQILKDYQKDSRVLFVGDGINDAPTLKSCDCGFTMNSGSDIAKSVGDVLLINNNLNSIAYLFRLSKSTMSVVKQNLFWAFFYNIICIPLAAGLFFPVFGIILNPGYAALAMCFSSVSVVLNSLRLKILKFS